LHRQTKAAYSNRATGLSGRERERERRGTSLFPPKRDLFRAKLTVNFARARARGCHQTDEKATRLVVSDDEKAAEWIFRRAERGGRGGGKKEEKEDSSAREFIKIPLYNVAKIMRDLGSGTI